MAEFNFTYSPLPGTSYTVPDFSSFFFQAPSIQIPTIPVFTPITIPNLPTLPTLESLIGVSDPFQVYVPYVAPSNATYAQQQEAIALQYELTNALTNLTLGYELAQLNRQALVDYNAQLSSLTDQLTEQRTNLTVLQSTFSANKATLDSAVTDYQAKVSALQSDSQRLSAAQTELNTAIADYNARLAALEGQQSQLSDLNNEIATATGDRDALVAQRDQLLADIIAAQSQLTASRQSLESAQSEVSGLEASITSLRQQTTVAEADIANLTARQSELQGQVAEAERNYLSETAGLVALQQEVARIQAHYQAGSEELAKLNQDLASLKTDLAESLLRYSATQQNIVDAQSRYNELQAQIATGQTTLSGLESAIGVSQTELSRLQSEIQAGQQAQATIASGVQLSQSELADLQAQISLGQTAMATLQTAIQSATASYQQLQAQISAGTVAQPGGALPEIPSNEIVTPEFYASSEQVRQALREAEEAKTDWNRILKTMTGVVRAVGSALLGIFGAITHLGRNQRKTQQVRPTQPGTILPQPGQRTYYAGFPPIPGVPDWVNQAGYGIALVALILMGAKLAKDFQPKK